MLYYQTIDSRTLELLKAIMDTPEFSRLNLVGGTSLALQIGHRKSADIDLFGNYNLDDYQFTTILNELGTVVQLNNSKNIKSYLINGIKVDFVNYPYPWIAPVLFVDKLRLADKTDIAAMKLAAVTGRGTKKDFIDIYFLLSYFSLGQMFNFYFQKYNDGSEFMVLKSLTYFEDAEMEVSPLLLKEIVWETVKSTIVSETVKFMDSGQGFY